MNILFVTIAWPASGERNLYSDLMNEFLQNRHEVYVLCADENISRTGSQVENGINILRVSTSRIRKAGKIKKAIAFFTLGSRLKKQLFNYWSHIRFDLIISHSPPVTLSGMLGNISRKLNSPVYYLLKDIWPDGPSDLGLISRNGLIYRYFRFQEKRMYKTAGFIGCMSPLNANYILEHNKFLVPQKVEVCPNTITPRKFDFREEEKEIRRKYDIPLDSTVFIFSGNIGKAHGLEFYLDAIEKLRDYPFAYFLIGGGGVYFDYVNSETSRRGMKNLGTYRRLPPDEFDKLLFSSDVGVVLLNARYSVPQFPSRMLAYLEASKPVLCSVNRQTDIGTIVEKAGCGVSTLHGDLDAFVNSVKYLCEIKESRDFNNMKSNARKLLEDNYSSAVSYKTIMSHFK